MKGLGLLETSRGGMTLTSRGQKALSKMEELMSGSEFPETPITVGTKNFAVLIKGAGKHVRKGIEQRDAAMIAGADGATTIVFDGVQLRMPGVEVVVELYPSTKKFILDNLKPKKGDVIIIGSAEDTLSAEMGAKSAALKLLVMMTPREP